MILRKGHCNLACAWYLDKWMDRGGWRSGKKMTFKF